MLNTEIIKRIADAGGFPYEEVLETVKNGGRIIRRDNIICVYTPWHDGFFINYIVGHGLKTALPKLLKFADGAPLYGKPVSESRYRLFRKLGLKWVQKHQNSA